MPTFDGLGLTPQQLTAAMWVFGIATALLYAWSRWKGSREADKQPAAREYSITGQFSDMQPVRELVTAVSGLLVQMTRIAALLEEEVERRQRERDADEAAARRSRQPKPRQQPVSRGQS
jgi:hypothetical protein